MSAHDATVFRTFEPVSKPPGTGVRPSGSFSILPSENPDALLP
jgi:hypothetical protein